MLAHVLALAVGLGSFALYMAAFFFPEVHRKHDFFWSGLGLFYALVLWSCDRQLTGAVLLGQSASVALLLWLGGQTLSLRRLKTPLALQTPATAADWQTLQAELTLIGRNAIARTPLGRWLGWQPIAIASPAGQSKLRASSVRDIGYEFLNDLDGEPEPVQAAKAPPARALDPLSAPGPAPGPAPRPARAPAKRPPATAKPPTAAPAKRQPGRSASPKGGPATPPGPPAPKPASAIAQIRGQLGSWISRFSRPKPSRPMIEIPPRESSLARTKPAAEPSPKSSPDLAPQTAPQPVPDPDPEPSPAASDIDRLDWGESNWPDEPVSETPVQPEPAPALAPPGVDRLDWGESNWPDEPVSEALEQPEPPAAADLDWNESLWLDPSLNSPLPDSPSSALAEPPPSSDTSEIDRLDWGVDQPSGPDASGSESPSEPPHQPESTESSPNP